MCGEDAARGGQGRRSGPVRPPLATATPAGTSASTGPAACASASTGLTSSPSASTGLTPSPLPSSATGKHQKVSKFFAPLANPTTTKQCLCTTTVLQSERTDVGERMEEWRRNNELKTSDERRTTSEGRGGAGALGRRLSDSLAVFRYLFFFARIYWPLFSRWGRKSGFFSKLQNQLIIGFPSRRFRNRGQGASGHTTVRAGQIS